MASTSKQGSWSLVLWLLTICAWTLPVFGQGPAMAHALTSDHERFAEGSDWETTVNPHWLAGGETFWYRRNTGPGKFEFIFVDASKGTRQAAFDHQKLAKVLNQQTGQKTDSEALPFVWIDPSQDGSVRFRLGDKKWQFTREGKLEQWSGDINEEKLQSLRRRSPSIAGTEDTSITFLNRSKTPLSLYWVDTEGNDVGYGTVEAQKSSAHHTYVGHVWQLTEPNSGKVVAVYRATDNDAIAVVEDVAVNNPIGDADSLIPKGQSSTPKPSDDEAEPRAPQASRAFVRNFNIWVRNASGKEIQLTQNGSKDNPYSARLFHSPDGRFVVAVHYTPAQEHPVYLIESSPKDQVQPKMKTIQYLKPGDRIKVDRPRLFDLEGNREVPTNEDLFKNPYKIDNVGWTADSSEYRFLYNERGHQSLRFLAMSKDGEVRAIVDESSKTFIDYSGKTYWREIKPTNELIWASERDGYNHLYLYDVKTGTVKNQITKGKWMMRSVVFVDEQSRRIWFRGFAMVPGQDPYFAHLARVNFDGTGFKVLTEGDGTHTWRWTPPEKYIVDTWSRVDLPAQTVVRDAETGKKVTELEKGNIKAMMQSGMQPPERFSAPGRDGKTVMHGIIIRPKNFDPKKKYPVIEQIYAGPQDFFAPKAFSNFTRQRMLADQGFVLVQVDGMGTNWRSKAFHDVCWKNLKDAGFPDRIAWMKAAATTRPWMDLSRVGIYGTSAGGQNALGGLLFHGDFYKAGVADSGCHDNRMDKIWWNEQWMGYPIDKSYEDSSNAVHAMNLSGALMLIVGEMDTNVDPSSTFQVVNALNKASKDYDLLFVPGGQHGAGSNAYGLRRQRDFFVKHLQGIEPPARNKMLKEEL